MPSKCVSMPRLFNDICVAVAIGQMVNLKSALLVETQSLGPSKMKLSRYGRGGMMVGIGGAWGCDASRAKSLSSAWTSSFILICLARVVVVKTRSDFIVQEVKVSQTNALQTVFYLWG